MFKLRIYSHKNEQKISMQTHTSEILKTLQGKDGKDYILTDEDKKEIAEMVEVSDNPSFSEGLATEAWVKDYAQPKGSYITALQLESAVEEAVKDLDIDGYATTAQLKQVEEKIPEGLADLQGDSSHRTVTDAEKTAWNNKSNFSGKYADLSGKPTKVSAFENDAKYLTSVPSEYVTDTELKNYAQPKGDYLTEEDFFEIKEVEKPDFTNQLPISTDENGNVLNGVGYVLNKSISTTGSVIDADVGNLSGFIPVKKGDIIRVKDPTNHWKNYGSRVALYPSKTSVTEGLGKNYNALTAGSAYGTATFSNGVVTWDTSTVTYYTWNNFAYVRIPFGSTDTIITVNEEITYSVGEEKVFRGDIKIPEEALDFEIEDSPLKNKKVVCFGDSLFGMYRDDTGTPAQIAENTGATVYNVGFGGCRMSTHPTSGYAEFSMWALAKAIAENNFSSQETNASKGSAYFAEQVEILKSIDFSTVDYIVIHYGTNDFGSSQINIGYDSPSTDYTTLCGAMRYSIEKLLTAYPKLKIFISVPVYRFWTSNNVNTYSETYTNSKGYKLTEFVEAIRSVATEYNLPVIDGYYGLGINKHNASTFLGDGTHHNADGRARFGKFIGACLTAEHTATRPTYSKAEIDSIMGSYINDVYALLGG